ncbi:Coproporphyrinogen dehydrogenase [Saliniradius amylolyticus]|uniref:Coproporphyrinogen-III oxidase n=1 Tax=Saliniradius amylolyticus TaxID=2183582 RepID=A0A2S2E727_9ALTE|nr:oxygen-independent coproporphyrinogen III oxidase [Saliniradius amylolyticus]AWL13419.1 Coproporphyrinogen dehydrogenase [Saliniradius amylolyticus]
MNQSGTRPLNKYEINGPRYTSYPTALQLGQFNRDTMLDSYRSSNNPGLSLYLHIPFCHSPCYYCGCNKLITRNSNKASRYLDYLCREIATQGLLFADKPVHQIHFGGGTPTFLSDEQLHHILTTLTEQFRVDEDAEISLEIDPRTVEVSRLDILKSMGINRLSIGVQDFHPQVQKAINREQDEQQIRALIVRAYQLDFASVSLDLIYGLPHQTPQSFAETIDKVIELSPDRLSVFHYAHLPERFAAQRKIDETALPDSATRKKIFAIAKQKLVDAGYLCIGMDHFAKADDSLAIAQQNGRLHRNFQGYTTHGDCDLLGMGVSAISQVNDVIVQNDKRLKGYYNRLDDFGFALDKGYQLSQDDLIRAAVIRQLICHFDLTFADIGNAYDIDFSLYFAEELRQLAVMQEDGLLSLDDHKVCVSPHGRAYIRAICMVFDKYLERKTRRQSFSRII